LLLGGVASEHKKKRKEKKEVAGDKRKNEIEMAFMANWRLEEK